MITRREVARLLAGGATAAAAIRSPTPAAAQAPAIARAKAKVVVIGGGPGGATAAKYIARDSGDKLEVTLVEPAKAFVTCYHSNLYLGGFRSFPSITHGYDTLVATFGIRHAAQAATAIDRSKRTVRLADGSMLGYDRLVLSPGIDLDYDSVPGWGRPHEEAMPHAWKAGPQTLLLKARLDAVPDGGLIVMIVPPNPYRCPPGPYERASMMAHALKASGRTRAKIIILDPKPSFSKQALFQEGWEAIYPGMIEWIDARIYEKIESVDPATGTVTTGFETYRNAALVNVIPAQRAGAIARHSGLVDATGYCPIDPASMKAAGDASIHVIGDACIAGDMPKTAVAANSQAKVAAMIVRSELLGTPAVPARYTNSCWSMIGTDNAVQVGGRYEPRGGPQGSPGDGRITAVETIISKPGESAEQRRAAQAENMDLYRDFTADVFG